MSPILSRIYKAQGGTESLDVLMKYMYVSAYSPSAMSRGNRAVALSTIAPPRTAPS